MKNLLSIIIIAALAIGCASSIYTASSSEQAGLTWMRFDAPKEDVFNIMLTRLQTGTAQIQTVNKDLGIITTDWMQSGSALATAMTGGQRSRSTFNIIEDSNNPNQSILKINMAYQTRSGSFGGWQDQPITKAMAEKSIKPIFEIIQQDLANNKATD